MRNDRRTNETNELTKYKAILAAEKCSDLSGMISLAGKLDEYLFELNPRSAEDVARGELSSVLRSQDAEMLLPYIDLTGYGRALLERDKSWQVQDVEQEPAPGGMVMT